MLSQLSIWATDDRSRWFLFPHHVVQVKGPLTIRSLQGDKAHVDPDWICTFEVTETQARAWAREQLGQTLDELKQGLDEKLAEWRQQLDELNRRPVSESSTVNRNAGSALVDLLKLFPSVLGNSLSGEETRVASAKDTMVHLQQQLKSAGIDLDDRFTNFPDHLAELRKDYERQRANKPSEAGDAGSNKP